jgi:hypothetical protein
MARDERLAAISRFTSGGSRLLLATDAAGEGLNLQQTCRLVVNLELPWNPMRLEQRIGRVDRIGQRRAVHVFHLIARGESQMLSRLQLRVAQARADIGGADPLGGPGTDFITHSAGPSSDRAIRLTASAKAPAVKNPDPTALGTGALWTPSLAREGEAEAGRIARARLFVAAGDHLALAQLEGLGPCASRARHWRTRAALGGCALMLWQLVAEDGSGRAVASTLVAVAVDDRRRHDDEELLKSVDRAAETWRERATVSRRGFISTRLTREQAIQTAARPVSDLFQPGLFERRGERAHMVVVDARAAADRDRVERLATIEQACAISFLPPHLLLVLTS